MKTIRLDGVIGTGPDEISSNWFAAQLPTDGSEIVVKIHSEGGSVVEGFRIFDLAAAYEGPKRAVIESAAYSIASFIPMAFDEVEIAPNGYMMLHNPYMMVEGDDEELAAKGEFLGKLKTNMVEAYATKSGMSTDQIKSILKAESYLNAREVVAAGFADRMTTKPIVGRVFAKIDSMPHGVVLALFGPGSGGNTEPPKETTMADSNPVATLKEIKAAFPKAKAENIIRWVEMEKPMASVAAAAAEEMMKENEELAKANAALSEELELFKAKAAEEEPQPEPDGDEAESMEDEEVDAKAEEDEEVEAKAKRRGVKPIARGTSSRPSNGVKWTAAIEACLPKCGNNKAKAVAMANRTNPGLRQAYLDEVNA